MKRALISFALAAVVILTSGVASVAHAAGGGVSGAYATTIAKPAWLKGTWVMTFAKGGTYNVTLNGERMARGRYTTTATTITFDRERGSDCTGAGTYAWKKSGTTMSFTRKREAASCQGRAAVLAHRFTQAPSST